MTSPPRFRVLAAHTRNLDDDNLNELLLDLPPERFAALLAAAFPRWRTPTTPPVPLRRRQATPAGPLPGGWQELARWTVHARVPARRAASDTPGWRAIGTVSHTAHPGPSASTGCGAGTGAPRPPPRWPRRPQRPARAPRRWPPTSAPWTTPA
jgi:hypothetical protein